MVAGLEIPDNTRPAGTAWLIAERQLHLPPRARLSFVSRKEVRKEIQIDGRASFVFPAHYWPGDHLGDQLEFALKYDGVDLEVLNAAFATFVDADAAALESWIAARPTSAYARRTWFLYEWLTGRKLGLNDVKAGGYVPLFPPDEYYTGALNRSRRHRVLANGLGPASFCPIVRRTKTLSLFEQRRLDLQALALIKDVDPDTLRRAVNYLYTKETRSSYAIEGEVPEENRAERFIAVLRNVNELDELTDSALVSLHNVIVHPWAAESGWRKENVYVAEQAGPRRQLIHFIAPKPEDLGGLMNGFLECCRQMEHARVEPIVQAAAAAFGFVFIHPFGDGNGRLHRLLIHHVLRRSGFTPANLIFPVSAVMLQQKAEYDAALESFSRPLMKLIQYEESEDGSIVISNDTARLYRFVDFTRLAEDLFRWTEATIQTELKNELAWVSSYKLARAEIEDVVDLPDRLLNIFVKIVLNNGGKLSKSKRSMFEMLSDEQIARLEKAVSRAFGLEQG